MLKKYVITAFLLFAVSASAQITITSANIPGVGFSYTGHASAYDIAVDHGPSGPNQVWTFTNSDWPYAATLTQVSPSSTPHAASFPSATLCTRYSEVDTVRGYDYARVTSDGYYSLGYAPVVADPNVWDSPELMLPLPLGYPHANWTSVGRMTVDLGGGDFIREVDSTIHTLDGWGTVNTPYGSSQTLRMFNRNWYTWDEPIYHSSGQGVSYTWMNDQGIEVVSVSSQTDTTNPNFTHGNIKIADLRPTAIGPVRAPVAESFAVGQNYPNPFNPNTEIKFDLPEATRVQLKIFNTLGQKVTTLVDEVRAAGAYRVLWDGKGSSGVNVASGVYVYQLRADKFVGSHKMILLR